MSDSFALPRFVLTGPSGWIGQAMLDVIARAQGGRLDGCVTAFASQARTMDLRWGEQLNVRALETIEPDDVAGAHVIHLAYLTKEKVELLGVGAFDATNEAIDTALLAALQSAQPTSLFVASSGAAMLAENGSDQHPYGVAKLRQEARFLAWAAKTATPTITGRIFNLAGPYINKLHAYAISDFALQAQKNGNIQIQASVPVFRSYLHVEDLCALVLGAAQRGIGRTMPIDLCGAEVVEMQDIARLVAQVSHGNPSIYRGPVEFAKPSLYLGDPTHTKILAMELGTELKSMMSQIADTIAWLCQTTIRKDKIS